MSDPRERDTNPAPPFPEDDVPTGTTHKIPAAPLTMPEGAPQWAVVLYTAQQEAAATVAGELRVWQRQNRQSIHDMQGTLTTLAINVDLIRQEVRAGKTAQEAEMASIRKQISALETQVDQLSARIGMLETDGK